MCRIGGKHIDKMNKTAINIEENSLIQRKANKRNRFGQQKWLQNRRKNSGSKIEKM